MAATYLLVIVAIIALATLGHGGLWRIIYAVPLADKFAHVILLAGLTLALDALVNGRCTASGWPLAATILLLIATFEETLQLAIPTRTFDLVDLTCNYAGIAIAAWFLTRRNRAHA